MCDIPTRTHKPTCLTLLSAGRVGSLLADPNLELAIEVADYVGGAIFDSRAWLKHGP